jgi:hypothetical protein
MAELIRATLAGRYDSIDLSSLLVLQKFSSSFLPGDQIVRRENTVRWGSDEILAFIGAGSMGEV